MFSDIVFISTIFKIKLLVSHLSCHVCMSNNDDTGAACDGATVHVVLQHMTEQVQSLQAVGACSSFI